MNRDGLHIWPRGTHFVMALANLDGSFTGTIYVDNENDPESFKELNSPAKIKAFFQKHYAEAIPVLGGLDFIVDQMMIKVASWEALVIHTTEAREMPAVQTVHVVRIKPLAK